MKGERVKVDRLVVDCMTPAPPYAIISGTDPDGRKFLAPLTRDDSELVDPNHIAAISFQSDQNLGNQIKKYEPYSIDWRVRCRSESQPGETDTWLYVMLAKPTAPAYPYKYFESVYDISCKALSGLTSASAPALWLKFELNPPLKRKSRDGLNKPDGKELTYWSDLTPAQTLNRLAGSTTGSTSCRAFCQLFKACLEIQGTSTAEIYEIVPINPTYEGIVIKEWQVIGNPGQTGLIFNVDFVGGVGIPAQNNATPSDQTKVFQNHFVVLDSDIIYDISYIEKFLTEIEHETASVFAFAYVFNQQAVADLNQPAQDLSYTPRPNL